MVCEKCWREASARSLFTGEPVSDIYTALCMGERFNNPCTELEQRGQIECPYCMLVYAYGEPHDCPDDKFNGENYD